RKVRAFSEGLIELRSRESISFLAAPTGITPVDSKGFVLLRTQERGKSFRIFRPPLIHEVERHWIEQSGAIGRWSVKVRASGARAADPIFVPFTRAESSSLQISLWDRAAIASRRLAERFAAS